MSSNSEIGGERLSFLPGSVFIKPSVHSRYPTLTDACSSEAEVSQAEPGAQDKFSIYSLLEKSNVSKREPLGKQGLGGAEWLQKSGPRADLRPEVWEQSLGPSVLRSGSRAVPSSLPRTGRPLPGTGRPPRAGPAPGDTRSFSQVLHWLWWPFCSPGGLQTSPCAAGGRPRALSTGGPVLPLVDPQPRGAFLWAPPATPRPEHHDTLSVPHSATFINHLLLCVQTH